MDQHELLPHVWSLVQGLASRELQRERSYMEVRERDSESTVVMTTCVERVHDREMRRSDLLHMRPEKAR